MREWGVSTRVRVSRPGDAGERQADALVRRALAHAPMPATGVDSDASRPLPDDVRRWSEQAFGHDFSRVRVHRGDRAEAAAHALDARAFAYGGDVVLGHNERSPALLAHELAHVALDRGQPREIHRKTKGEEVVDKAHTGFLDPDASVKKDVDVMHAALREIKNPKQGKKVEFNRKAVKAEIDTALATLGKSSSATAIKAEWDGLVDDRGKAATAAYIAREKAFFAHFETPLASLTASHPGSQAKYWLKNTPAQVVDVIIAAADADMPADQLYTYAMKEGLVDYVRDEAGVGAKADPMASQLAGVSTTKSISGFQYLGTDDFFTELTASKEPLNKFLPKGYDTTKPTRDPRINEHGRTVQSAIFPDLKMGLQALSATMKRRRALFLADVTKYGYAKPTTAQLVYWTYAYYNAGENNGQLKKYSGKRTLEDWINAGEFSNALKLLRSWQMIKAMAIF